MINLKEIKNKILKKENFYSLVIILLTFLIDRYSKFQILKNFSESIYYVNDFLNFDLVWNTGIGFGLLNSNSDTVYAFISFLIGSVIIILFWVHLKSDKFDKITFSLIIGGAMGNFYDRLVLKAVPDFIDLHIKNFHWFTFNVADIFITIGVIIFLIKGFFIKDKT